MATKKNPIDEPGSLERLSEYGQEEITADLSAVICDLKKHDDCPSDECDDCPAYRLMLQLEYDIQTEVIQFSKNLIKEWAAASIEK